MAATNAEVATNQALRFANALRWERGQRKEGEERLEAANEVRGVGWRSACVRVLNWRLTGAMVGCAQELGKARKLNKKLTAELQATSALLNSAAKAAELLQKQKEKTRQLESQLRAAKRELDVVRESGVAGRGPDASAGASLIRPDEHEMLLDTLQRQQKDVAELRELLAARDEEIGRLRGDAVTVNSPLKMDPAELLRGAPRVATQSGSDPVIQSLWIDDNVADDPQGGSTTGRPGRAPLGSLDNNARSSSFSAQKRKPYAQPRIGRGCTCGGCSMDDAGNYRLMCGTASGSAETEAETVIDLGNDVDDDAEHDEFGSGQVVEIVEGGDGDLAELDLAGAEENANTFDNEASKSGFGEGPVPGGHAPYYCTSLDCELAVVKQLGWEPGAGTAVEDEGGAPVRARQYPNPPRQVQSGTQTLLMYLSLCACADAGRLSRRDAVE